MENALYIIAICCMSFFGPYTGKEEGNLKSCTISPNCVSSESWKYNLLYKVNPYKYSESKNEAFKKLLNYFENKENVFMVEAKEFEYIRVIYFTKIFRFPDKVEFLFKDENIQVRSQSVFGFTDFFANRIRIYSIRKDMNWEEDDDG